METVAQQVSFAILLQAYRCKKKIYGQTLAQYIAATWTRM